MPFARTHVRIVSVGNFIIGVSYYLSPGFVVRIRSLRQRRAMSAVELSMRQPRSNVFVAVARIPAISGFRECHGWNLALRWA
jgi:hypothetical protein